MTAYIWRGAGSRSAFSGDQLPVGITGRDVPGKRPDVGDAGHRVGAAIDHVAATIACGRHELRHKAQRKMCHFATQLGIDNFGRIDRYETRLNRLAARLALANYGLKPVIDLALQQSSERTPVTGRVGR